MTGYIVCWWRSDGAYRREDAICGQQIFGRESTAQKHAAYITDNSCGHHPGGAVARSLDGLLPDSPDYRMKVVGKHVRLWNWV